jgi:hypothetical protein
MIRIETGMEIKYSSYLKRTYKNVKTGRKLERSELRETEEIIIDEEKQCLIYKGEEYKSVARHQKELNSKNTISSVKEFLENQSSDLIASITSPDPEKIRVRKDEHEITWKGFITRRYEHKDSGEFLTPQQMKKAKFDKDFNLIFQGKIFTHIPIYNYSPKLFATEGACQTQRNDKKKITVEGGKKITRDALCRRQYWNAQLRKILTRKEIRAAHFDEEYEHLIYDGNKYIHITLSEAKSLLNHQSPDLKSLPTTSDPGNSQPTHSYSPTLFAKKEEGARRKRPGEPLVLEERPTKKQKNGIG